MEKKKNSRIVAKVQDPKTGEIFRKLLLPASAADISFEKREELSGHAARINNYLVSVFKKREKEARKMSKREGKEIKAEDLPLSLYKPKYLKMVREAIFAYFEVQNDKINWTKKVPSGDMEEHLDKFRKWQNGKLTISILGLYEYLFTVIFSYEPIAKEDGKNLEFEVNGTTYVIPCFIVDEVLNKKKNPDLTVQENVEVFVVEDYYNKAIKGRNDEEDYKQATGQSIKGYKVKAALSYKKNLKKIAIFCRKKGEELPDDYIAFNKFVDDRIKELASISMQDALNALFFLRNTSEIFRKIQTVNSTLRK